jgi:alcohol dehydrogenase (NADP+)
VQFESAMITANDCSNAMLKLAAEKGVRPIIDKVYPMSQAGEAVEKVKNNDVRYRFVLKNDLK